MAEQEHESKTEEPTPRRREKAREEGQVVSSSDLQAAAQLISGAGLLTIGGEWLITRMADTTTGYLSALPRGEWTASHASRMGWSMAADLQRLCLPFVMVVMAVGLLAAIGQSGPIQIVPLKWDLKRLDPLSGWSRLWSWESVVRGLFAIGKVTLIAAIGIGIVTASGSVLATAGFRPFSVACGSAWDVCGQLLLLLSGVTLGLGVFDFGFKWYRHEQRLRLTKQELKEEQKEETGDPHLKTHLRKRQREAAESKGIDQVPEATVVLTNPTHLSIALKYEHGVTSAPVVLAKGEGFVALRIRQIAAEHGITVMENKPLVRALYRLVDVGQEIPLDFYQAIAEILSSLYRLRGQR